MTTSRVLRAVVAAGATGLLATGAVTGPAGPAAPAAPSYRSATSTLVAIRAAHHPGFDRVVLEFDGPVPAVRDVRYVPRLLGDASGLPVRIAGRAVLRIQVSDARAHEGSGSTAPGRTAYALPNVLTTVRAGDFEGVVTYGVGLAKRTPFTVLALTGPSRLVVDVRAAFPTVARRVYFFDEPRFLAATEPYFVPVVRPVRPGSPAVGLLDRLFAGPLPTERARGLRLLRSRATGFADVSVADRIARVRLTGGCSSGGSTVTVAGEVLPTLRRLPTVDWVKLLDPAGATEDPDGPSDSIPVCLEP